MFFESFSPCNIYSGIDLISSSMVLQCAVLGEGILLIKERPSSLSCWDVGWVDGRTVKSWHRHNKGIPVIIRTTIKVQSTMKAKRVKFHLKLGRGLAFNKSLPNKWINTFKYYIQVSGEFQFIEKPASSSLSLWYTAYIVELSKERGEQSYWNPHSLLTEPSFSLMRNGLLLFHHWLSFWLIRKKWH